MPLLDASLTPPSVLNPRQQADQRRIAGQANPYGVVQDPNQIQAPQLQAQGLLDQLLGRSQSALTANKATNTVQSAIDSLIGWSTASQHPGSVAAPAPPSAAAAVAPGPWNGWGSQSNPIIGRKNYLTGHGDPALRSTAQAIAGQQGWDANQFNAWDAIINAESGWRPTAQNPTSTAYGLGQFLNSTWGPYGAKTSDPAQQLAYMAAYIKSRYGTPEKALQFHNQHSYY